MKVIVETDSALVKKKLWLAALEFGQAQWEWKNLLIIVTMRSIDEVFDKLVQICSADDRLLIIDMHGQSREFNSIEPLKQDQN